MHPSTLRTFWNPLANRTKPGLPCLPPGTHGPAGLHPEPRGPPLNPLPRPPFLPPPAPPGLLQVCALVSKTALPVSKGNVGPLNFISLEAIMAVLQALAGRWGRMCVAVLSRG